MSDHQVRRKKALIAVELLHQLMIEGNLIPVAKCIQGLPAGSKFITGAYKPQYCQGEPVPGSFELIFEHESFEPIPDGAEPPIIDVILSRADP